MLLSPPNTLDSLAWAPWLSYSCPNPKHISQCLVLSHNSVSLCGMNEWMNESVISLLSLFMTILPFFFLYYYPQPQPMIQGTQCNSVVMTQAFSGVFWGWLLLACKSRLLNIWDFFFLADLTVRNLKLVMVEVFTWWKSVNTLYQAFRVLFWFWFFGSLSVSSPLPWFSQTWNSDSALTLINCVTLDNLLAISKTQFPHL